MMTSSIIPISDAIREWWVERWAVDQTCIDKGHMMMSILCILMYLQVLLTTPGIILLLSSQDEGAQSVCNFNNT